MQSAKAFKKYQSLDLENRTAEASPEHLVCLLYEKACSSVQGAIIVLEQELNDKEPHWQDEIKRTESFHLQAGKAIQIVSALKEIIDFENGEPVASQLDQTYSAILAALWNATKQKKIESLRTVLEALQVMRDGWHAIKD